MNTIDNLDPRLKKYLEEAELRRSRLESPEYQARQGADSLAATRGLQDQQQLAGYAKAFSQLGTLRGRAAGDTSVVDDAANQAVQRQKMMQQGDMQDRAERDRQTGLKMDTLQYLQARNDKAADLKRSNDKMIADRNFDEQQRTRKLQDQKELSDYDTANRIKLANVENDNKIKLTQNTPAPVDKVAQKSEQEANYRYVSLKNQAEKLKQQIKENGTMSFFGPQGSQMDSNVYQMAVDFAKLVDPDSVAREGEVAAAQKYMLAFRDYGGATTRNSTALAQIDNYLKDLDARLAARKAGKEGNLQAITYKDDTPKGESGTAYADDINSWKPHIAPVAGTEQDGYVFIGGDPSDQKNWKPKEAK